MIILSGSGTPKNLTIYHNSYIAGHNELVEAIHACGAKAISQLYHVGRNVKPINIKGMQPVAPSPIPCQSLNIMPRELSTIEIGDIVRKFVEAAIRAKIAGYDGVELHGAHGYLIAQFMSASSNKRNDRYGGDLNERMTFPLEIVQGIRKELGADYPIIFRLSGDEFIDRGRDLEESKRVAKILEDARVDVLDVSAGTPDSRTITIEPMSYAQGWKIYLAESIKKVVKIPVIGVGVIRTPEFAEKILKDGKVDFVALGRALLADPYWPQKARVGREEEIIPCISCNDGCIGRVKRDLDIRCTVNPLTGREQLKDSLVPVSRKKKVFVIGGGPAGIMAALTAKKRGHRVVLYEKSDVLGGQLHLAKKPPGKEKVAWFLNYLLNQVYRQRIKIILGHPVNPKTIAQANPDAVIIATGAIPLIPDIPGIKSKLVYTAWEVLEGKKEIKDKVVLVAGGGTVGCETALYLASNNRKVIIVEMLDDIALDMESINRIDLVSQIQKSQIDILLRRKIVSIEPDSVILSNQEKKEEQIKMDFVVLALGATPANGLIKGLKSKINEIYVIGDSYKPRKIIDSVYEGFQVGLRV